jgi:excisionase family DNA binding protein
VVKIIIDLPGLYDPNEAAEALGIGYATLYRWIKAGKLIPVSGGKGKRTVIPKSEIERLKKEREGADAKE